MNKVSSGVFDKKPEQEKEPEANVSEKVDFDDSNLSVVDTGDSGSSVKKPSVSEKYTEEQAARINSAIGTNSFEDELVISKEDLELAEKLVFNGYTDTEVFMPNFPTRKFTICSTNAEEMGIIDEVVFDLVKENEDEDGNINLNQSKIDSLRNSLFVAIGYKGCNGEELCKDKGHHLNTIKRALVKLGDLELEGDMKKMNELNTTIKKALLARSLNIRRMPISVIDFLSGKKSDFDRKMFKIMNMEGILPKS